jgi:CRISPR-associated protein Cas1
MSPKDLQLLPTFSDGWSYLYLEHCRIDQEAKAVAIHDQNGKTPIPCANLALLMLGPGVVITHAAIVVLADHGCLVVWCGEEGVRFYSSGMGLTRSASNLLYQAALWAHPERRMEVVRQMYQIRFNEYFDPDLTLQQIRGMEGVRVRDAYARASKEMGVPWNGRNYSRGNWAQADPVNRALSSANACLYGICQAAIVSAGFSTALGFIHTGKMLSFVYDIADLYKADITIPVAFTSTREEQDNENKMGIERRTRIACRDAFHSEKLLARMIPDIKQVLLMNRKSDQESTDPYMTDHAAPAALWDPVEGKVQGGQIYGVSDEEEGEKNDDGLHT